MLGARSARPSITAPPGSIQVIFLQANWIVGLVCAYIYFAGGRLDARHGNRRNDGPWWALASILVTVAVIQLMNAGWLLVLFSQILLLVGITIWRVVVEKVAVQPNHALEWSMTRCHVHVQCPDGEAKPWLEPQVALAQNSGLNDRQIRTVAAPVEDHTDEIRAASKQHFGVEIGSRHLTMRCSGR